MSTTNLFKRWKQGMLDLSIIQQLKGKMIGYIGGIIGLILALIAMVYRKQWGFSIFVFFIIWIQWITYVGTRQQYIETKKTMEEIEVKNQDIISPKINQEIGNNK